MERDVGLWLALRRVQSGRVFMQGQELVTRDGRPLFRFLVPFVRELLEHGHARVSQPAAAKDLKQQVHIAPVGEGFLLELDAIVENRLSTVDGSRART